MDLDIIIDCLYMYPIHKNGFLTQIQYSSIFTKTHKRKKSEVTTPTAVEGFRGTITAGKQAEKKN